MNPPDSVLLPDAPPLLEDDVPVHWRLLIHAAAGPLLLPRVLQKITVPEIELRSAGYDTDESGVARIVFRLRARPARARLAAARLEKIIGMQAVVLSPAD